MTQSARSSQTVLRLGIRRLIPVGSLLLLFSTAVGAQAPVVRMLRTARKL
jgi:hypothetical protein